MTESESNRHEDGKHSGQERLRTFRSLFVARENAYAIWKGDRPVAIRGPLSDEVLKAHLSGEYRVGTYLIQLDGKTPFLVFDVDVQKQSLVRTILKRLHKRDIAAYVERSKSKGFHVWVFFAKPLRPVRARAFAKLLLHDLEDKKIEIFPKQDQIKSGGLGNCIWLPMHGPDVERDHTVFLDSAFKPVENQWSFLRSIRRIDRKTIIKVCGQLEPADAGSLTRQIAQSSKSAGGPITEPGRNTALTSLAGAMRRRGATQDAILAALSEENQRRCTPALDAKEVEAIASSVSRYEPAPAADSYCIQDGHICAIRQKDDGPVITSLCNFQAHVTEEITLDDGVEPTHAFVIEGNLDTGKKLPAIRIPAPRFAGLNWVTENWGIPAIVNAGFSKRDQLREAIQRLSPTPRHRTIFTHTGWREVAGKWFFVTSKGAIGNEGIDVDLGTELQRYRLPSIPKNPNEAMRASLRLLELAPLTTTVPLWATMFRAPLAAALPVDFSLWLEGQTGSFKSTLAALFLSHYGIFDAKSLPGSWESTANQLEHRAFTLKDIPFVVDDYSPKPTLGFREMEAKAARLLRAQGNLSGRGRLRADATERPSHPPRGIIVSTGEQHPPGQSLIARTLLVQMEKKTVDVSALSLAQHQASMLPDAMAGYISWLAPWMKNAHILLSQIFEQARSWATSDGHLRVAEVLAHLWVGSYMGFWYAEEVGACSHDEACVLRAKSADTLLTLGRAQLRAVETERPTHRFLQVLSTLLSQGRVVILPRKGTTYPRDANGTLVGWEDKDFLYLQPEAAYEAVSRFCRDSGEAFILRHERLARELNQEGFSERDSDHFTVVKKVGGSSRRVISLFRAKVEDLLGERLPGATSDRDDLNNVTVLTGSGKEATPEELYDEMIAVHICTEVKKPVKPVTHSKSHLRHPRIPLRFPRLKDH